MLTFAAPPAHAQCETGVVSASCDPEASAYQVVGVSEILAPYSSQITSYSVTEMGYYVQYYYYAYLSTAIYNSGKSVASGSVDTQPDGGEPYAQGATLRLGPLAAVVGNSYEVNSVHYLICWGWDTDDFGSVYYVDPYGFSDEYVYSAGVYNGNGWEGDEEEDLYGGPYIYLGATETSVAVTPPVISGIYNHGTTTPASPVLGGTGTFDIVGLNLTATGAPTSLAVTGVPPATGQTLTIASATATKIEATYSVPNNTAAVGVYNVKVTTPAGVSNAGTITVVYPPPTITGTYAFSAGTTTSFTITGTKFGTSPALAVKAVNGTGNISSSIIGTPTNTQINATVSIDNTGFGNATVTVTANGNSVSAPAAYIVAVPAPPPQIMFQGNNAAGTTQAVYVGQQIALTASVTAPVGLAIVAQSWAFGQPTGQTPGTPEP